MKSEAEVGDEDEAEADLSMRRPSETINYAKYLLRYVCVCCVCINLVKFAFGCAGLTTSLSSRSLQVCTEIGSTLTLLHAAMLSASTSSQGKPTLGCVRRERRADRRLGQFARFGQLCDCCFFIVIVTVIVMVI